MNYFLIGDEDAVLGFGMVGVQGKDVRTPEEAESAFRAALDEGETGIVIITEAAAEMIRPLIDHYTFSEHFPLIIEIPGREGRLPGRPSLRDTVNKAIGISIT